jgi:thiosulfate/3-mercaptopyruvate sulfurtransferase
MPWLINAAQLDKFRKSQKSLVIFDASWHMPDRKRDAEQEFSDKHIIGAQFFNINLFTQADPDAPHTNFLITDEKIISECLGELGIRNDYKIILYDNSNLHTACRALWMLKVFGHNPQLLYILDGGVEAWEKNGGKVENGMNVPSSKSYQASMQTKYLRNLSDMKTNLADMNEQVLDVRHAVRFCGGPEVRPGLRRGHIPQSASFPYTTMFDTNGMWRPLEKIRQQLLGINTDLHTPIISTCGSGMTAPILNFALDIIGQTDNAVYDGSWSEWGAEKLYTGEESLDERPVETYLK